jgi:hypothetical protein
MAVNIHSKDQGVDDTINVDKTSVKPGLQEPNQDTQFWRNLQ